MIESIIGQLVEYESAGQLYTGRIIDKFTLMDTDEIGHRNTFDLYLICMANGKTYKISPVAIKRVLPYHESKD